MARIERADVGVIGGSGFYSFLTDVEPVSVGTPFGPPSSDVVMGALDGRPVAFLARHGTDHRFAAHRVNYRANLWALRSVGVRQVLAPCAVGSLDPALGPGVFVVPDQLVDRTWGRGHTVYDEGSAIHVGFADPFCPTGRAAAAAALAESGHEHRIGGTLVVINGPRFSTRAESRWHQQAGWTLVGMTTMPEAGIARELAMCFTSIAMVTDLDAGLEHGDGVTQEAVFTQFARNLPRLKALGADIARRLPEPQDDATASCACRRALDGLTLPFQLPG
ncbi:MAG: S-methyl-5'-thioadenosine phosphorylase [Dermatophilaceae bacterium]